MAIFTLTSGGWEWYESLLRKWGLRLKGGFIWGDGHNHEKVGHSCRQFLPWISGNGYSSRNQRSVVALSAKASAILAAAVTTVGAVGLAAWAVTHGSSPETLGKALASLTSSAFALQGSLNTGSDERDVDPEDVLIAGLHNAGNGCFLNVILQALASSDLFVAFIANCITTELESEPKLQLKSSRDTTRHGWWRHGQAEESSMPLATALAAVLEELSRPIVKQHIASPLRVIRALAKYADKFDMAAQQDAAEALAHLAAALKEERNRRFTALSPTLVSMGRLISHESHLGRRGASQDSGQRTDRVLCSGKSEASLQAWRKASMWPMEGIFSSLIKCQRCGHQFTMQLQTFNEIVLSPPTMGTPSCIVGPCTVQDCLRRFTSPEHILNVVCAKCSHLLTARTISPSAYFAGQGFTIRHCTPATGSDVQEVVERLKNCRSYDDCGCDKIVKEKGFAWQKQESMATKCLFVAKAPQVLCMQIQRLVMNASGHVDKLRGHVAFPFVLDLLPYTLVFSCAEFAKGPPEHVAAPRSAQNVLRCRDLFSAGAASAAVGSGPDFAANEDAELTAAAPPCDMEVPAAREPLQQAEPGGNSPGTYEKNDLPHELGGNDSAATRGGKSPGMCPISVQEAASYGGTRADDRGLRCSPMPFVDHAASKVCEACAPMPFVDHEASKVCEACAPMPFVDHEASKVCEATRRMGTGNVDHDERKDFVARRTAATANGVEADDEVSNHPTVPGGVKVNPPEERGEHATLEPESSATSELNRPDSGASQILQSPDDGNTAMRVWDSAADDHEVPCEFGLGGGHQNASKICEARRTMTGNDVEAANCTQTGDRMVANGVELSALEELSGQLRRQLASSELERTDSGAPGILHSLDDADHDGAKGAVRPGDTAEIQQGNTVSVCDDADEMAAEHVERRPNSGASGISQSSDDVSKTAVHPSGAEGNSMSVPNATDEMTSSEHLKRSPGRSLGETADASPLNTLHEENTACGSSSINRLLRDLPLLPLVLVQTSVASGPVPPGNARCTRRMAPDSATELLDAEVEATADPPKTEHSVLNEFKPENSRRLGQKCSLKVQGGYTENAYWEPYAAESIASNGLRLLRTESLSTAGEPCESSGKRIHSTGGAPDDRLVITEADSSHQGLKGWLELTENVLNAVVGSNLEEMTTETTATDVVHPSDNDSGMPFSSQQSMTVSGITQTREASPYNVEVSSGGVSLNNGSLENKRLPLFFEEMSMESRGVDPYNNDVKDIIASSNHFVGKECPKSANLIILGGGDDGVSCAPHQLGSPQAGAPACGTSSAYTLAADASSASQRDGGKAFGDDGNGFASEAVLDCEGLPSATALLNGDDVIRVDLMHEVNGDGLHTCDAPTGSGNRVEAVANHRSAVNDARSESGGAAGCFGGIASVSLDRCPSSTAFQKDSKVATIRSSLGCDCLSRVLGECQREQASSSEVGSQNCQEPGISRDVDVREREAVMSGKGDGCCLLDSDTNSGALDALNHNNCCPMKHVDLLPEASENVQIEEGVAVAEGEKVTRQKQQKAASTDSNLGVNEMSLRGWDFLNQCRCHEKSSAVQQDGHRLQQQQVSADTDIFLDDVSLRRQVSAGPPGQLDRQVPRTLGFWPDAYQVAQRSSADENFACHGCTDPRSSSTDPRKLSVDRMNSTSTDDDGEGKSGSRQNSFASQVCTALDDDDDDDDRSNDGYEEWTAVPRDELLSIQLLCGAVDDALPVDGSPGRENPTGSSALSQQRASAHKHRNEEGCLATASEVLSNEAAKEARCSSLSASSSSSISPPTHRQWTVPSAFLPGVPIPYGLYGVHSSEKFAALGRLPALTGPARRGGGGKGKAIWYELVSVVVHIGGSGGGHYIVYRKLTLPRATRRVCTRPCSSEKKGRTASVRPSLAASQICQNLTEIQNAVTFSGCANAALGPDSSLAQEETSSVHAVDEQTVCNSFSYDAAAGCRARRTAAGTEAEEDLPSRTQGEKDVSQRLGGGGGWSELNRQWRQQVPSTKVRSSADAERVWFCVSDSRVMRVPEAEVLRAEASLLFYQRMTECTTQPCK